MDSAKILFTSQEISQNMVQSNKSIYGKPSSDHPKMLFIDIFCFFKFLYDS